MTSFKCCTASTKSFSFTRNIHTHTYTQKQLLNWVK